MPKNEPKYICCSCGKNKDVKSFYKSYSDFYYNGLLPICKDCFSHKFMSYATTYKSNKMAMQRMCMAFDIYFDESAFDSCDVDNETVIGKYFRRMNISQYKNKTLDNAIKEGSFTLSGDRKKAKGKRIAYVDEYDNVQEETANDKIDPKDIEKWGIGFTDLDYKILNSHYKTLKKANPNVDDNQEIFIMDMCYTKMQQMKAAREGRTDDYNKLTDSYRKSFQQSGIKFDKDSSAKEEFLLGVNAEMIEKYTPSEYYKNKELYKDYDNIGGYIERFLLRPLRNLMFGTKERDETYYVKDEEDDGGNYENEND